MAQRVVTGKRPEETVIPGEQSAEKSARKRKYQPPKDPKPNSVRTKPPYRDWDDHSIGLGTRLRELASRRFTRET